LATPKPINVKKMTDDLARKIIDQREEILEAFLAKHGMQPEEAVQVITFGSNTIEWRIEKRVKKK
jgi:hypothetical protein